MNARTSFAAVEEASTAPADAPAMRHDGWLPDRQCCFLAAVADGNSVEAACRIAGKSVSSAFAFRRTAAGAAFTLGWHAANLLAREALHSRLMTWALEGCRETVTRVDDKVTHRDKPNQRVMLAMLTRLEEQAKDYGPDELMAARLIAQEFDHYLGFIDAADIDGAIGFVAEGLARPYEDASLHALRALERARDRLREEATAASETRHNPPACKLHEPAAADEAAEHGLPEPLHNPPACKLHEPTAGDEAAAHDPREPCHNAPAVILHEPATRDEADADGLREPRHSPPACKLRKPTTGEEAAADVPHEPHHNTPAVILRKPATGGEAAADEALKPLHSAQLRPGAGFITLASY